MKSGFVAILGRPNVGKSTLLNALMGQTIAAVSPRPQTTRRRQLGILTLADAQVIFDDTPGLHVARHKLGEYMNSEALEALAQNDIALWVVDVSQPPNEEDARMAQALLQARHKRNLPVILVLNKSDVVDAAVVLARRDEFWSLLPDCETVALSAQDAAQVKGLLSLLVARLPENPPYFPAEQLTDLYEREIAADLLRAAALLHLRDEVPHGIAVRIDEYRERGEQGAHIAATLFVERESHKGIVIGKGGAMLKIIGAAAREQIEAMSGRKVFLEVRVKVRKNWCNDENELKRFGFSARK
ncbi:MAG: hypothetical protein OHK0052_05880 [Anaerolineales bacterium]